MKHTKAFLRRHAGWAGMTAMTVLIGLAVFALTFSATQAQPPTPTVEPVVASIEPDIEYAPNTLLLKLIPGVTLGSGQVNAAGASVTSSAESLNTLLSAFGARSAEPVFGESGVNAAQVKHNSVTGLERIYRVQWTSAIPVRHAVAALAADPAVEYAEPDYMARPARIPNDPEYFNQWALAKINAPAAWDVNTGDPSVIIAIVDSGVDATLPDFADRLWVNDDPINGADDDLNGKVDDLNGWNVFANSNDISDPNGHGSEVGGVAGASGDNGAGVAGMCWTCKLMFVNAMQASGVANYSDVAAAVQYAASNGAHVINLSLGGYADSAVLRDAVREAAITAVIVAGAGNDDSGNPFYPAAYSEVLAVAATDANDQKAVFSNFGAWVDVSAPGKDIRTTTIGGYATDSGTSLAAPFVAGLAGLIKSQHPTWTAEQVKWQVLNTAVDIDALNPTRAGQLGAGRIDAGAALATSPQPRATVESYAIDGQANARPAPGQAFQLVLNVRNLWLLGQNLQGTLTSSDPYVTIIAAAGAFGDITPGQLGSNSGDPFGVTVSGGAPYNHALQFTLNLSGAGGYSLAVPFSIQMCSSTETLGNTIYSVDTTWTRDKSYVLNGAVIVNQGVTLTIQPGTVIKANPGKFMRVDGTLIARGAAEQPIVFTTNSITNATWSGLRFADTAVDASYDAAGTYLAGSVLQFVEISYADVAASLNTRSPYIADSTFTNNTSSIGVGNNNNGGVRHIERNTFESGDFGVSISGGQSLIRHNSFMGLLISISGHGSPQIIGNTFQGIYGQEFDKSSVIVIDGSPTIIGNVIKNNRARAITVSIGTPVIRNNVILDSGSGINGFNLQSVDIEHNLIADNDDMAVALEVQGGGYLAQLNSVRNNTIIHNTGYGIQLGGQAAASVTIANNNLFGNGTYDLYLTGGQAGTQNFTVNANNNFWNVDASQIPNRIRDCTFDDNGCGTASSTVGQVAYNPPLADPEPAAPAFARGVTVDPNPVGFQRATVTVDFSAPMMTGTLPTASFRDSRRGTTQQVFSDTAAYVMSTDIFGRVWFGLNGMYGGSSVRMYDGHHWTTYTNATSGLSGAPVSAMFGASNGDIWFALGAGSPWLLSRLQGTTWYTYTGNLPDGNRLVGDVMSIDEDGQGAIWFGGANGTTRYDGSTWRRFSTVDGLADNSVRQIASDGQGRMWFLAGSGGTGSGHGINVYDGVSWATFGEADGLPPAMYLSTLFADSLGRIWVGYGRYDAVRTGSKAVAMFDGAGWHFFGSAETNNHLNCAVNGIAETPDGTLWFSSCGRIVTYDGVTWSISSIGGFNYPFTFDSRGNLWYNSSGLTVHWGGIDYPFTDGQWLSATRFQAGYDFDANIAPGFYEVQVDGAVSSDGMVAYAGSSTTFQVDFGAGVTLDPPPPPQVTAQTNGSLNHLAAIWHTGSPNIDQYRYAIGTTPGARNVVGWTYLAGTSVSRTDLNLVQGQTYYVTAQARNTSGLWSANGVSSGVVAGQVPPTATPTIQPGDPFVSPETGGTATGTVGNLQANITVPPGAVSEPVQFTFNPAATPPSTGGFQLFGQAIEITAMTRGGAQVTQFNQPITLVIRYSDADAAGIDEAALQLRYWSDTQQTWVQVPAMVDTANNTISASLDHLTLFAILYAQGEADDFELFLPTVNR